MLVEHAQQRRNGWPLGELGVVGEEQKGVVLRESPLFPQLRQTEIHAARISQAVLARFRPIGIPRGVA